MAVEPDTVYLLPPMKEMIIKERKLLLSDRDPRHGLALPIDHFFRSLAQDAGERARRGRALGQRQRRLARHSGRQPRRRRGAAARAPRPRKFNGMPLSAIATGVVDQVLPPEEIAGAIAALGRPILGEPLHSDDADGDDLGVNAILRLLRDEYGIDFSHYKATTVTRRIERRLALNRALDLDDYVEQLRANPRELNALYEDLLIGVTRFFRDDDAFQLLEDEDHPRHRRARGRRLRRRSDPRLGAGLRHRPGGVLDRDPAARAADRAAQGRATSRFSRPTCTRPRWRSPAPASTARQQLAGIGPERLERYFTLKPQRLPDRAGDPRNRSSSRRTT